MRHETPILRWSAVGTAFFGVTLQMINPPAMQWMEWTILAISIAVVGIPHGALDHLIAARLLERDSRLADHLRFYGWYLLLMGVLAGLWMISPISGFLLFMVISVLHFGQADMESFLSENSPWFLPATLIRGTMIIGLILAAHPEASLAIISEAIGSESWLVTVLQSHSGPIQIGISIGFFLGVGTVLASDAVSRRLDYLLDSVLLFSLFSLAGPLLSFAIYFALWHSIGHIGEIRAYFESKGESLSLGGFFLRALPFTLVSFLGLGFLVWITRSFSLENQIISLTFILISVLTLPHMVVAHRMFSRKTT